MVGRRVLLGVVAAAITAAGVAALAGGSRPAGRDVPVAVFSGSGLTSTTVVVATTLALPPAPEPPVPAPPPPATVTEGSSEVLYEEDGGVKVVNSGSAVASTGGNSVVGPGSASVVNGPVSAVGNSSEVRVSRP